MQVILLERVAKLGQMGDVVDVKSGYARNFLLPQGKAKSASESNIAAFESEKAKLEAHNLETKKEADALAASLNGQNFVIIRSASDTGALYGSVNPRDAADVAKEAGFTIDRKQFTLKTPIKELGLHDALINLKGLTPGMLVTLGEQKILTLEDFADLASDELTGGHDVIKGERVKIQGYLEDFALSKEEADELIMSARNIIYKD